MRQADAATIEEAGKLLRAGHLVAFPTETVYGLGADATRSGSVASIYETKGRPRFNPLIVHVASLAAAEQVATLSTAARRLAECFWPGPLTLVLPLKPDAGISDLVTAGLETVAVRVPSHAIARAIITAAGRPIAAPSANVSGHVSPTEAAHVLADLGDRLPLIVDGGATDHGLESTIVDASGESRLRLLRPGAIPREAIEAALGAPLATSATSYASRPSSPGQLESHYAPHTCVRLDAKCVETGEALLAFGGEPLPTAGPMINLSAAGDLKEAATNLFRALRALDATGAIGIAVMPIPNIGLGEAINDRLTRAAAPR